MNLKSLALALLCAGLAQAQTTLAALDRVAVLMPKAKVLELLGKPDELATLQGGLRAELYRTPALAPLIGAGCIYDAKDQLAAQALMFEGNVAAECRANLAACGFTLLEEGQGQVRMLGKDDDTGTPLVATLRHEGGVTTLMTFEKAFHDRTRVK